MGTLRSIRVRALVLAAAALAPMGCTSGGQIDTSTGGIRAAVGTSRWSVSLTPQSGSTVAGSATVIPVSDDRTRVSISVQGAPPNLNLPWHIHQGICGGGGAVYGSEAGYPMLGTAGDGRARLQVDLLVRPPTAGTHHMDVHAGPGDARVVACGDLVPRSDADLDR